MSLEKQLRVAVSSILKNNGNKRAKKSLQASICFFNRGITGIWCKMKKVFVAFCPMADSNKGAYWLSIEKKVINPYFGNKMLTCGEVKQVIE